MGLVLTIAFHVALGLFFSRFLTGYLAIMLMARYCCCGPNFTRRHASQNRSQIVWHKASGRDTTPAATRGKAPAVTADQQANTKVNPEPNSCCLDLPAGANLG